jgi:hypothetical protein
MSKIKTDTGARSADVPEAHLNALYDARTTLTALGLQAVTLALVESFMVAICREC